MEFNREEILLWFKLSQVPKLGPVKLLALFTLFGNIQKIFKADKELLLKSRIFNIEMISELEKIKNASDDNFFRAIDECISNDIAVLPIISNKYPLNLKRMPYPPKSLFLKGNVSLLESNAVAVVGTRHPSEEALKWTFKNSKILAENNFTVISGGAIGVDSAAHQGALEASGGKTIAVLGTGFFKKYPEENLPLFEKIEKNDGLLISEHLPNFPGSRFSLLQRNRITSGLSQGLVMVASGGKGGAMVQTKIAFDQKIPIFCPSLSLNLQPNEGVKEVIEKFGGKEIFTIEEVILFLSRDINKTKGNLEQFINP